MASALLNGHAVVLFTNNGLGGFSAPPDQIDLVDDCFAVVASDLDGDEDLDLGVANYGARLTALGGAWLRDHKRTSAAFPSGRPPVTRSSSANRPSMLSVARRSVRTAVAFPRPVPGPTHDGYQRSSARALRSTAAMMPTPRAMPWLKPCRPTILGSNVCVPTKRTGTTSCKSRNQPPRRAFEYTAQLFGKNHPATWKEKTSPICAGPVDHFICPATDQFIWTPKPRPRLDLVVSVLGNNRIRLQFAQLLSNCRGRLSDRAIHPPKSPRVLLTSGPSCVLFLRQ